MIRANCDTKLPRQVNNIRNRLVLGYTRQKEEERLFLMPLLTIPAAREREREKKTHRAKVTAFDAFVDSSREGAREGARKRVPSCVPA